MKMYCCYKCRLCNTSYFTKDVEHTEAIYYIKNILGHKHCNKKNFLMLNYHLCKDGSIGISDLTGFSKVDPNKYDE